MPSFRKKPVVIEAWQWLDEPNESATSPEWIQDAVSSGCLVFEYDSSNNPVGVVHTFEGAMTARVNDWIIQGVQGELYPCKPDIFEATYEPVKGDEHA